MKILLMMLKKDQIMKSIDHDLMDGIKKLFE